MDLLKSQVDQIADEKGSSKCKTVLEKLIDILIREQESSPEIRLEDLLHKLIGLTADAGLEDVKERIISGIKN